MKTFKTGLLFTCLSLYIHSAESHCADLKSIESNILNYSYKLKSRKSSAQVSHEDALKKYADILPSVDIKSTFKSENKPSHSIEIKQKVPYPQQWYKEKEALNQQEEIAKKTLELDRQKLLNEVRKLYFQIQFLEKKKELNERSFKLVEQFKKDSELRYNKGFINASELSRAKLPLLDLERTLLTVNNDLRVAKEQLLLLMGKKEELTPLKTELEVSESFFKVQEKDFRKHLERHRNQDLAIKHLQKERARLSSDAYAYKYLPQFDISASYPLEKGGKDNTTSPFYTANLNWNLFAGGSERAEQRRLFALKAEAEWNLKDTELNFSKDIEKSIGSLLEGRKAYLKQKEGLDIWENITLSNQKRFKRGLISSKDLSDDINNYLNYSSTYYELTYNLISRIADFCLLAGKEDLFHEWI